MSIKSFLSKKKKTLKKNKNIFHKHFDKIYALTLPKRESYIKKTLQTFGIKPEIFTPVLKKNIDIDFLHREGIIDKNNLMKRTIFLHPLKKSEISCSYGHISILKKFIRSKAKNCLIFEDDISDIDKNNLDIKNISKSSIGNYETRNFNWYKKTLLKIMKTLPRDYDILFLGRCCDNCSKERKINDNLVKVYSPLCLHAYCVSRKGAINIINNLPLKMTIDLFIAKLIRQKILKAYASYPSLFFQNIEIESENNNPKESGTINTECIENNNLIQKVGIRTEFFFNDFID